MFSHSSAMEPLLPSTDRPGLLSMLAREAIRKSSVLTHALHPITRSAVAELLRTMNSYYSNLIEGHATHPLEIEKALRKNYSKDPAKHALQLESVAHIEVERLMKERLHAESDLNICSVDFLCWIHREFYERLPQEFREVEAVDTGRTLHLIPGEVRTHPVTVGAHHAPLPEKLPTFLARFQSFYSDLNLKGDDLAIAAASSHHRLAWIHPFLDGNGRVARLFTHAYLIRAELDGCGLWSLSRGLARRRDEYRAKLAIADGPRRGDLDGRGNLTDAGLAEFCRFFLEVCIDQMEYMNILLELDGFASRISSYVERRAQLKTLSPTAFHLLRDVMLRGEVPRGEAARITGLSERSARTIVSQLCDEGLLLSDAHNKPVRLGLPLGAAAYFFPRLFPEGVEIDLIKSQGLI